MLRGMPYKEAWLGSIKGTFYRTYKDIIGEEKYERSIDLDRNIKK